MKNISSRARVILTVAAVALASASATGAQTFPPWSKGQNNPAAEKGYSFAVGDVDNVPDLHGRQSLVMRTMTEKFSEV